MSAPDPYYQDDHATIYCGDAREILPLLHAEVLITDPPYGIQHTGGGFNGGRRGVSITNDRDTSMRDAVLEAWGDRPALVFGSPLRPRPVGTRQVLCWDKGNAGGCVVNQGESHRKAKLNESSVLAIRRRHAAGERIVDIARDYPVGKGTIRQVVIRETWKGIEP